MKARRLPQEGIVLEVIENLHEVIWAKIASGVKKFIKGFIEDLLNEEVTTRIGAAPYERSRARQGYRNGHYLRSLLTKFGLVEDIRVPRVTPGGAGFSVLNRYEHRRRDVDAALGRLFLSGVSTRKLKSIARELFGKEISAQTVSNSLASLDQELEGYRTKPLADTAEFLFLDGISSKVREIGIEKKVVLCALGIHRQEPGEEQPRKELLSFQLTEVEDTGAWQGFWADLKGRGLFGKNLKLIITDGNPGLLKALKAIYPFIKVQRCIAHKLRNVAVKIRNVHQAHCLTEAKLIFAADNRQEALKGFKTWEAKWVVEEERAVKCMRKDLFHCLHFYSFPPERWKSLRTTQHPGAGFPGGAPPHPAHEQLLHQRGQLPPYHIRHQPDAQQKLEG
jgi:transposase-like protein